MASRLVAVRYGVQGGTFRTHLIVRSHSKALGCNLFGCNPMARLPMNRVIGILRTIEAVAAVEALVAGAVADGDVAADNLV